jgi:putative restriction endonuclease
MVKARVNQDFFRKMILASYNNTCCITGLSIPELLVAGHIIPWSKDEKNRLNPRNGIAINALHDRAYELGYLTIMPDYTIKIASSLKKDNSLRNRELFLQYNEKPIILPSRFLPDPDILKYHNEKCFLE